LSARTSRPRSQPHRTRARTDAQPNHQRQRRTSVSVARSRIYVLHPRQGLLGVVVRSPLCGSGRLHPAACPTAQQGVPPSARPRSSEGVVTPPPRSCPGGPRRWHPRQGTRPHRRGEPPRSGVPRPARAPSAPGHAHAAPASTRPSVEGPVPSFPVPQRNAPQHQVGRIPKPARVRRPEQRSLHPRRRVLDSTHHGQLEQGARVRRVPRRRRQLHQLDRQSGRHRILVLRRHRVRTGLVGAPPAQHHPHCQPGGTGARDLRVRRRLGIDLDLSVTERRTRRPFLTTQTCSTKNCEDAGAGWIAQSPQGERGYWLLVNYHRWSVTNVTVTISTTLRTIASISINRVVLIRTKVANRCI